ncbi:receptor like protein 15 [Abeliophyllum distichum]|uniref:Receptor like protein 15 n=1 Tax=Abeliophyllum distichum TaxID=126358 RepID=A0ABD1RVI2_9LAMI
MSTIMPYMDEVKLERAYHMPLRERTNLRLIGLEIIAAFTTKRNLYSYKGSILDYMSGIDLSYNKLYGEIPTGLGKLSELHALNLSHNNIIGTIPETFSNLSQLESLDLSYNNLSGKIPTGLVELKFLGVFTVAHNNLTGSKPVLPSVFDDESEESGFMDMEFFYIRFTLSYVSVVLCIAIVLYINPHWRSAWFHLIEVYIINLFFRLALRSKEADYAAKSAVLAADCALENSQSAAAMAASNNSNLLLFDG